MNWNETMNNSELVYASTIDDKGFRSWSLKKTICNVSFYESKPIDDIDRVICGIIESNNSSMEEIKIATILGFNVIDDFETTPKRYADKAELDIFRAIIEPVLNWGLVEYISGQGQPTILKLTDLGCRALSLEKKYKFYSGQKILLENPNIKPAGLKENLFFPFFSALGEYSAITRKTLIPYIKVNITEVFDIQNTELIERLKLQSNDNYIIYKSESTNYFEFSSCQVDIRLYKKETKYFPVIFHNSQISFEATELLNSKDNADTKEKKIEWGLYLKLIKDPVAVLDYKSIIPFEDLLELDSLIKDNRLSWNDKQLFFFIAENANANQWFSISNHCPLDVLKQYLQPFSDKLDWNSLSLRIDDDFLIQNATKYPWNFEVVSAKEDISIEVIKILLLIPELKEQEWDWYRIMPQLDFEFIKTNIDTIDFELSDLTKTNIDNVKPLLVKYPAKRWNWTFISTEYDLSYVLDNILIFSGYLNLKNLINRAFASDKHVDKFCKTPNFVKVLINGKESTLSDYQPNLSNYSWTNHLIDLLERIGYLTWESGSYISGFECNPYIEWSADFFNKYHSKIVTQNGFDFVSAQITDNKIVTNFPDFNWNWDIISENDTFINNLDFLLSAKDKLNYSILLKRILGQTLEAIFDDANVLSYLESNQESWTYVTEKSSKEFVLQHIDYNWDWTILTKRFCSTIKHNALSNPKFINKWDWKYLSNNLDNNFIISNLSKYSNHWNWEILCVRLDKSDLLIMTQFTKVAECISVLHDDLKQKLWKILSAKFNLEELENLISKTYSNHDFVWNYQYFYNLPNFKPTEYLRLNCELIEWKAFSGSNSLNQSFQLNTSLFNYEVWLKHISELLINATYQWDFKSLSRLDSINWNDSLLSIESEKWDWEYLSEFSSCFKKDKEFTKRFRKFSKYINFNAFSKRTDSDISEKLLADTINNDWDWAYLSQNLSVNISLDFVDANKEKPWDWKALSYRNNIKFKSHILIKLINEEWDWEAISNRTDLYFSEELIIKLLDKPVNWYLISRSKTFLPNANTLSLLKAHNLDWKAISKNIKLTTDILWNYKDNLDWLYVTRNQIVEISDNSFLTKYRDYVDWDFISQSENFKISIENLKLFKDKLNWIKIDSRKDFKITNELLEPFADVLNWSKISESMEIHFSEQLIEKYRNKWNWQSLRKNPQIIDKFSKTIYKYKPEFNCVEFLEQFPSKPFIYHFTHLFNALYIIKKRKILSRTKAEGKFANAAGNLVARRDTAHNFARFYYRTQTPTQFYNECLGWDSSLKTSYGKSYYTQALNLGLPKCPIPIFFKFDLWEVLMKMPDKCYYSTGNMQTNWAKIEKISENPNSINTIHLYSNANDYENYKQYSQQEFLVFEEFDFSDLDSFEIICYNDEYADLLKSQLGNDPICKKINADGWNIFHRGNRKLIINKTETEISITSEYQDNAYLSIRGEGLKNIKILNPERIQKEAPSEIIAYPEIKFLKTKHPIEIYFVDTTLDKRDWLIYKN